MSETNDSDYSNFLPLIFCRQIDGSTLIYGLANFPYLYTLYGWLSVFLVLVI